MAGQTRWQQPRPGEGALLRATRLAFWSFAHFVFYFLQQVAVVRAASTALLQSAIRVRAPATQADASRRRRLGWKQATPWGFGWAASILLLFGLLAAAGHWRQTVMHGWPPSIRLYTALGAATPRS